MHEIWLQDPERIAPRHSGPDSLRILTDRGRVAPMKDEL